ncbi:MAG: hypothetical protein IKQ62_06675 [Bacteroidaceae bacterium]|nr:hypothetical protein [Bacteroidaceae bacterium]MBR7013831.1 hypothetical protein [Prevotella sp.]
MELRLKRGRHCLANRFAGASEALMQLSDDTLSLKSYNSFGGVKEKM